MLVRLHPGFGGGAPEGAGVYPSGGEPKVWRWTPDGDVWSEGEAPPITARAYGGWAFDGSRLAVVGGVGDVELNSPIVGAESTGAVYEVDADAWTVLPNAPWPAMHPDLAWDGDELVYLGGSYSSEVGEGGFIDRCARWEGATGWTESPALAALAPGGLDGMDPTIPDSLRLTDHGTAKGTGVPGVGVSADEPGGAVLAASDGRTFGSLDVGWLLVEGGWEEVPIGDPMTTWWGDHLLATSPSLVGAVEQFQVAARLGPHRWVSAALSPVSDLWAPAVVVVGDRLYVVGTPRASVWQDGRDPVSEAWVLDLSA